MQLLIGDALFVFVFFLESLPKRVETRGVKPRTRHTSGRYEACRTKKTMFVNMSCSMTHLRGSVVRPEWFKLGC